MSGGSADSTRPSRSFGELRELARHRRVSFVRDIHSEVTALADGRVLVVTRLLDEYHDMSTAMLVDAGMTILDFGAVMERMPYPVCPEAERAYDGIIGLSVFQRGILRAIRERVERTSGCTHLTELIEASIRALFAGLYNIRREHDLHQFLDMEEIRQLNLTRPVLGDTCRSFRRADQDDARIDVALDKLRRAGLDPEELDPHRSTS